MLNNLSLIFIDLFKNKIFVNLYYNKFNCSHHIETVLRQLLQTAFYKFYNNLL